MTRQSLFPTTCWHYLGSAVETQMPGQKEALEHICQTYRGPVMVFITSQMRNPGDAEDLTQGFFQHLIQNRWFALARRERGRFRTFLLTSLRNFLINENQRLHRLKRHPGDPLVSFDTVPRETELEVDVPDHETPERLFNRKWASTVVCNVLNKLRAEFEAGGELERFEAFKNVLAGFQEETYAVVARQLGMSEANVKVSVHRFRARYRQLFRDEIANQVTDPRDVDDEIAYIIEMLSTASN